MWTLSHMSKAERNVVVRSEVIADPTAIQQFEILVERTSRSMSLP